MKDMKIPLISVVAVIVIVGLAYVFVSRQNKAPLPMAVTPADTTSQIEPFLTTKPDVASLQAGGNSYKETRGVYVLLYPNDYAQDSQDGDKYVRLVKRGATQKGQTEMYDGVIVVLETVDLQGQSLTDWVDTRIKEATADGTSEVLQPKTATTLNSYPGFTYQVRSLGSSTYLVVQKDTQSRWAVSISFLVADPQNLGYQAEVDALLSTLEFLQ